MQYLKKLWRGQERLALVFWVYGFLGIMVMKAPIRIWDVDEMSSPSTALVMGLLVYALSVYLYSVFIWVAVWRSAKYYKGNPWWPRLAKLVIALAVMREVLSWTGFR